MKRIELTKWKEGVPAAELRAHMSQIPRTSVDISQRLQVPKVAKAVPVVTFLAWV